jgi:hypothetical protein
MLPRLSSTFILVVLLILLLIRRKRHSSAPIETSLTKVESLDQDDNALIPASFLSDERSFSGANIQAVQAKINAKINAVETSLGLDEWNASLS